MKAFAFLSVLAAGSLVAGEKAAMDPVMPPPAPSLWQWFVGGSIGYLDDFDTEIYTIHAGVDFPNQLAGWDQSAYLEIGYATLDENLHSSDYPGSDNGSYPGSGYGPGDGSMNGSVKESSINFDADLIPVTINYKLERALTDALNVYLGGGVGAVNVDVSGGGSSDDDWTFFAQVFAGLLYNVNETWEIYGGGRWIYIDDFELFGSDVDNQDDFMIEIGARINL